MCYFCTSKFNNANKIRIISGKCKINNANLQAGLIKINNANLTAVVRANNKE